MISLSRDGRQTLVCMLRPDNLHFVFPGVPNKVWALATDGLLANLAFVIDPHDTFTSDFANDFLRVFLPCAKQKRNFFAV